MTIHYELKTIGVVPSPRTFHIAVSGSFFIKHKNGDIGKTELITSVTGTHYEIRVLKEDAAKIIAREEVQKALDKKLEEACKANKCND